MPHVIVSRDSNKINLSNNGNPKPSFVHKYLLKLTSAARMPRKAVVDLPTAAICTTLMRKQRDPCLLTTMLDLICC